jgi:HEAT repeat protein
MKLVELAALALVALPLGCASDPFEAYPANPVIQREVAEIVKRVRSETGPGLYDDLKRLVAYDVFAVRQVCELAEDDNARLRSNALFVLAQVRDDNQPDVMKKVDRVLRDALEDPEASVRYEAATGLALRGQWDVLPVLIDGLEDPSAGVRFRCHEQLVMTTSQDFGYSVDGTDEERKAAVGRWRAYYSEWKKTRG